MSAMIRIKCINCGNSITWSAYGYEQDTLGIPFFRCDNCGELYRDRQTKEWIQMSKFEKILAISPRWGLAPFFGALILSGIIHAIVEKHFAVPFSPLRLSFLCTALVYPSYYFVFGRFVNSLTFLNRYTNSLLRTGVPEYKALLSSMGKIYDASLPLGIRFSEKSRQWIASQTELRKKDYTDLNSVLGSVSSMKSYISEHNA